MDLTDTLIPKSDQLNAEDLLTGPRTVTVEKVTKGSVEQPVDIHLVEFPGRPFRPSKTVRRILVAAWGAEATAYTGRRMTLYRDPDVKFGGMDVGGIRVSHLSDISKRLQIALTTTRGKRAPFVVDPLPDEANDGKPLSQRIAEMLTAFNGIGITEAQIATKLGKPRDQWDAGDVAQAGVIYTSITKGGSDKAEIFPESAAATTEETVPPAEVVDVSDEQIADLAMAREQRFGKTNQAKNDWAAWVAETLGKPFAGNDNALTREEADDLLALLASKDGAK